MKFDALTVGALAFAGFAAYAYLGRNKGTTVSGGAGQVYDMLGNQRKDVGAALSQNTQQLAGLTNWTTWANDKNRYGLATGSGGWGLTA